jgi:biopolymer transport protein ExbB
MMWSYFMKGGLVMWPLLALSVLGVTVAIWRWLAIREATSKVSELLSDLRDRLLAGDIAGAMAACDERPGPISHVVRAGLQKLGRAKEEVELSLQDASAHELALLERGLPVLATIAMVAPLLGFLGTVTGMINSFDALAAVGLNNPAAVASGISEALITTAAGLIIAIPVQMAYNYFVARVNATVRRMESAANLVLEAAGESAAPARSVTPVAATTPRFEPSTAGA